MKIKDPLHMALYRGIMRLAFPDETLTLARARSRRYRARLSGRPIVDDKPVRRHFQAKPLEQAWRGVL